MLVCGSQRLPNNRDLGVHDSIRSRLTHGAVHWFNTRPLRPEVLAKPITLRTTPSVSTPRSANQLRKAKQLNGTATASNKSRFMVSVSGLPPHVILALLVVATTPSKKFRNQGPCRMHGGILTRIGSFDCIGDPHGALGVSRKLVVDPNECAPF